MDAGAKGKVVVVLVAVAERDDGRGDGGRYLRAVSAELKMVEKKWRWWRIIFAEYGGCGTENSRKTVTSSAVPSTPCGTMVYVLCQVFFTHLTFKGLP